MQVIWKTNDAIFLQRKPHKKQIKPSMKSLIKECLVNGGGISYNNDYISINNFFKELDLENILTKNIVIHTIKGYKTSDEYWESIDNETFKDSYTTKNGETVVAFGYYGHD
jgi:hypothetical protein